MSRHHHPRRFGADRNKDQRAKKKLAKQEREQRIRQADEVAAEDYELERHDPTLIDVERWPDR